MTRIISCILAAGTLFVIVACSTYNNPSPGGFKTKGERDAGIAQARAGAKSIHDPQPTDRFRINMRNGYGPNSGPTANAAPTPFPPDTSWFDVNNWQFFLNEKGFPCTIDNKFGPETTAATKNFQSTPPGGALPRTGMVNSTTYLKAISSPWYMTPYPTVTGAKPPPRGGR